MTSVEAVLVSVAGSVLNSSLTLYVPAVVGVVFSSTDVSISFDVTFDLIVLVS